VIPTTSGTTMDREGIQPHGRQSENVKGCYLVPLMLQTHY
jgi:hypothetical protein